MRITRYTLAGLAAALASGASHEALAQTTVNTPSNTPLVTSGAGDVTVTNAGSITVTAGQTAITVDSDNDVSNAGSLLSTDVNTTTGIRITNVIPGTRTITNTGTISLGEAYVRTDSDGDGNADGVFAQGMNRYGIVLDAGAGFVGDIINSGTITIEGNDSAGILLDSLLTGNLTQTGGGVVVTGDNTYGIAINQGVTGNVNLRGTITARGVNATALYVDGPIGGSLQLNGSWLSSGYSLLFRPSSTAIALFDPDDFLQGGPTIHIRDSVTGGVVFQGIGVEDDEDDDGDTITETAGDTDDDQTVQIRSLGGQPAVLVEATAGALNLGNGTGWGLRNRGSIEASGLWDGIDTTAIELRGQAGSVIDTSDGISLESLVRATAYEAESYAVRIAGYADVPQLLNRNTIESISVSDTAQTAYAVRIDANSNVQELTNTGSIRAIVQGEVGTASAISDASGSLDIITNSGEIIAQLVPTDSDLTDNIVPVATGPAIAIDVSANAGGVVLSQIADTPFNDDDGVDNDVDSRPETRIIGDIRFGGGGDTFDLLAGTVTGNIDFAAGSDFFNIDNGASFVGRLTDTGALTIDVQDGLLSLQGGTTNLSTATFGADSELRVLLSNIALDSTTMLASGTVTFDPGATVIALVPNGLPLSGSHTFLTAGSLVIDPGDVAGDSTGVLRVQSGPGTPYIYNLEIVRNAGNVNALDAIYTLKSAAALGLSANQGAALLPLVAALGTDDEASLALASLDTAEEFFDAYQDLMPSFSSAGAELAATAIQQQQSASTNRLATTRLQGLNEVSVWAQEIGYGLTRTPPTANGQAFDGRGFGVAIGIDGPLDNGALFGLSASFIASEVEEEGRPDGEIAASFGQLNAYLGTALGPIDLDFVGGFGVGQMTSQRFVEIGTGFSEVADAEWWAYEGHGAIRASMPLAVTDWFVITPQAAVTYVGLQEDGYTEENGGPINYQVDDVFSQRLWGDAGLEFSARMRLRTGGVVAPRLFVGYRANLIDEPAERTVEFLAGGGQFTLQDEEFGDGAPLIGFGIDASNGASTFTLAYEGELGDQIERHSLNASVRFRF